MTLFYGLEINYESTEWLDFSFGKALREIRRHEKMTMSDLAKKSKVSQSYISQLENDIRLPSDKVIQDLSYALARGKTTTVTDPFADDTATELISYDEYTDDFQVEQRQQDIYSLLRDIKLSNESKVKKEEYLNAVSTSKGEDISISQADLQFLKSINSLNERQRKFVMDFIDFLLAREN